MLKDLLGFAKKEWPFLAALVALLVFLGGITVAAYIHDVRVIAAAEEEAFEGLSQEQREEVKDLHKEMKTLEEGDFILFHTKGIGLRTCQVTENWQWKLEGRVKDLSFDYFRRDQTFYLTWPHSAAGNWKTIKKIVTKDDPEWQEIGENFK